MALSLLENNTTFRETVMECAKIVEPLGIDLLEEFRNDSGWANSSLGALGLVSIQLGLVDVLQEEYGIVPDGMLGHSAGKLQFVSTHSARDRKAGHVYHPHAAVYMHAALRQVFFAIDYPSLYYSLVLSAMAKQSINICM